MTVSFLKKLQGSGSARIYELKVPQEDGRLAYFKLAVEPLKEVLFNKACKEGLTINLKDYGEVLDSYFILKRFSF